MKRTFQPLVSIIMPAFNAEKYIGEAIQSVLDQEHKNFELIIINDGSKDATAEIVKLFTDKRIRYLQQENKGVSVARNRGLEEMKGDFFCFLDADDVFTQTGISHCIDQFKEGIDVVWGARDERNETLTESIKIHLPPKNTDGIIERLVKLNAEVFFKESKIYMCFYWALKSLLA